MGKVIDYLLKERGVQASQDAQSFEVILNSVFHRGEAHGAGGNSSGTGMEDAGCQQSSTQ